MISKFIIKKELLTELRKHKKKIAELESGIGETLETEDKVREIEKKYKFIVNAYGELMTLINRDYVYELVNDSLCRVFEKTREDFIGKTIAEVWGEQKFEKEIKRKIDLCFIGEIFREEDSFIIAGGERRYYSVIYYPYKNEKGEVSHIVGVTNDITKRKEAELALKKSEEKLRVLNKKKDKYLSIINSDLEKASDYVKSLLPEQVDNDIVKINWKIVPSVHLSGDSFGYHWIDDEYFAIYILDVTGHGVGAALHSVSALNTLKFQILSNTDFRYPEQVLKELNNVFQMSDHHSMFITMWYCVYNKSKRELRYGGAAHPPLFLFSSSSEPVELVSQNIMIGVEKNIDFHSNTINLERATKLYLYTDGAYEVKQPNGKMMEIDDLVNYLKKNRNVNATEIDKLYNYLIKATEEETLEDDFTMIKINFC